MGLSSALMIVAKSPRYMPSLGRVSLCLLGLGMGLGLFHPIGLEAVAQASPSPTYVNIQADQQSYEPTTGKSKFIGNVRVKYQDFYLTSPEASMTQDDKGMVASFYPRPTAKRTKPDAGEDVMKADKILIYLDANRMAAEGNAVTTVTSVAANPITIYSDTQEFNNSAKTMSAAGNVKVNFKDMVITGPRAQMQMGAGGKAERAIFSGGGVRMVNDKGTLAGSKVTMMVGSGNVTAEGDVVSNVKSDGPKPIQLTSSYQQFDKASDTVLASGTVKIIYDDYVASGPKATIRMSNGAVKNVLLTGRSTIIDSGRQVTADKITITTTPKHFDAYGNVQTKFKTAGTPVAAATPAPSAKKAPTLKSGTKSGAKGAASGAAKPPAASGNKFEDF
jgi:lipopolysaccharide export system protein LptA